MQRTDLVRENKELQGKVDSLADGLVEAINKNTDLEDENRKLRKEISSLNVRIRDLKENIKVLYHNTTKKSLESILRRLEDLLRMNWI